MNLVLSALTCPECFYKIRSEDSPSAIKWSKGGGCDCELKLDPFHSALLHVIVFCIPRSSKRLTACVVKMRGCTDAASAMEQILQESILTFVTPEMINVLLFVGVLRAALDADSVSCRIAVSATGSRPLERRLLSEQQTHKCQDQHYPAKPQNTVFQTLTDGECVSLKTCACQRVYNLDYKACVSLLLVPDPTLHFLCKTTSGVGSATHCSGWGCCFLCCQRARWVFSQSPPLWMGNVKETHLKDVRTGCYSDYMYLLLQPGTPTDATAQIYPGCGQV